MLVLILALVYARGRAELTALHGRRIEAIAATVAATWGPSCVLIFLISRSSE